MNAVTEVMDELRKALALVDQLGNARDKAECELAELQRRTSEALAQAVEWQRERDDARATWEAVCINLNDVEAERDRLRDELAEANARRDDLRTALEWSNEERDRLQRERDEAIKARDQYLRERDQARLAEERARESLEELDEAIYDCLPSDDDGDAPLDCVERAADQLRALAQERDEARAEVEMLRGVDCCANGDGPCGVCRKCAFRRGAEAMRLACQQWCRAWENDGNAIADALADLRVEDKP